VTEQAVTESAAIEPPSVGRRTTGSGSSYLISSGHWASSSFPSFSSSRIEAQLERKGYSLKLLPIKGGNSFLLRRVLAHWISTPPPVSHKDKEGR
jgi:hypothetical protein